MARDAAVRPSEDMSSKRPSIADLERAAARYGSIHERWDKLDSERPQMAEEHPSSAAATRSSGSEPAPKTRESFPPPSEPPFRPPFDTLIGVPRNSFAPADAQKALRASTDAVAAPIAFETYPRPRRWRGVMAAAVVLIGAGAVAARFGAVEHAEALLIRFDVLPVSLRSEPTAQSVESLRASAEASTPAPLPAPTSAALQTSQLDQGGDTRALPIAAASRQALGDEPPGSPNDKGAAHRVPKSDMTRRATPEKSVSNAKRLPAKRGTKASKNPASEETSRSVPQAATAKAPRHAKPRSARQKPPRKTEQTGIIRQSPF